MPNFDLTWNPLQGVKAGFQVRTKEAKRDSKVNISRKSRYIEKPETFSICDISPKSKVKKLLDMLALSAVSTSLGIGI